MAVYCFSCGIARLLLSLSLTVLYSVRLSQFHVPCVTYLGNIVMTALLIVLWLGSRKCTYAFIFYVLSLLSITNIPKLSWNLLKTCSWNVTFCCWDLCHMQKYIVYNTLIRAWCTFGSLCVLALCNIDRNDILLMLESAFRRSALSLLMICV